MRRSPRPLTTAQLATYSRLPLNLVKRRSPSLTKLSSFLLLSASRYFTSEKSTKPGRTLLERSTGNRVVSFFGGTVVPVRNEVTSVPSSAHVQLLGISRLLGALGASPRDDTRYERAS